MSRHRLDRRGAPGEGSGPSTPAAAPVVAGKTSILVVDEQAAARATEISCFERIGCTVHSAGALEEALEAARAATLDIAVVSEHCLENEPCEACASLRSASGRSDLPIVLISDEDAPGAIEAKEACGCSDYVPRSVSQMELVRRVANILQIPPRRFLRTMVAQTDAGLQSKLDYLGHSRDISRTGILIETSHPMSIDQVIKIKFLLPYSNSLIDVTTQITRVLRNPITGQYEVGCRFVDIDAGTLETIADFLTHDSPRG